MSEQLKKAVNAIAQAIAKAEGFYNSTSDIPQKADNPGDLVRGDLGGGTLGGAKITVYPSLEDGWTALDKQVLAMLTNTSHVYRSNMTIAEVAAKYTATQQSEWAENVAHSLGVPTTATLDQILAMYA